MAIVADECTGSGSRQGTRAGVDFTDDMHGLNKSLIKEA